MEEGKVDRQKVITDTIFIKPKKTQTEDYITGRFG